MSSIPHTIAEFTPQAVTDLLSQRAGWADLVVSSSDSAPVGTGQMANSYRLKLEYSTRPNDAPETLIAKVSSADPDSRQMGAATGAYQREVLFYQHLGTLTDVRSPECFYSHITADHNDFVLLLEDMGPARTVEQIGGCTADQADLALEQAAALHAGSWGHDKLTEQSWLPVENVWNALAGALPQVVEPWLQRFGSYLEPEQVAVVHRLSREVTAWLATLREHRTLWHGDFRLDNLLFDAQDGRTPIAVVDWQSVAAAPGIIDVSYLLGTSLTETDRATHERALVGEYHQRLTALGVTGYDFGTCWQEYRTHSLYGLVLCIAVSLGVASTERGDAMFGAMARRAAAQIIANDSFAALAAMTR
jgi:hypothetical protein